MQSVLSVYDDETDERKFVTPDELLVFVEQFKNENGREIVEHLKSKI